jgi:NADH-quinone oxidoreductase subunit K/multicomponent Na+:H+ antiporter subunit C
MQAKTNLSQSMALTILVADTIVAVVALALAVQVRKAFGSLDLKELTQLKR